MSGIPVPSSMDIRGDKVNNWASFRKGWNNYFIATAVNKKDAEVQVATFLCVIGNDCRSIFDHLPISEADKKDLSKVINAFEEYFKPKVNIVYERFQFGTATQGPGEPIDTFVTRLRKLASTCNFGSLADEFLRDRIVVGIKDDDLRIRLLREPDLNLDRTLDLCRTNEVAAKQLQQLQKAGDQVHFVKSKRNTRSCTVAKSKSENPVKSDRKQTTVKKCKYCGTAHKYDRNECPAWGKKCSKCGKDNHFAKVCRESSQNSKTPKSGRVHTVEYTEDSDSDVVFVLEDDKKPNRKLYFTELPFNQPDGGTLRVRCQLDSGASCSVMSLQTLCAITQKSKPALSPPVTHLKMFNGSRLDPLVSTTL